jgi:hypothetical protein
MSTHSEAFSLNGRPLAYERVRGLSRCLLVRIDIPLNAVEGASCHWRRQPAIQLSLAMQAQVPAVTADDLRLGEYLVAMDERGPLRHIRALYI